MFHFSEQKPVLMYYFHLNVSVYRRIFAGRYCMKTSLTLREERRLRVFEYKVLRRIFGPRRDEVAGEWTEL